jgi:hypothetical protein
MFSVNLQNFVIFRQFFGGGDSGGYFWHVYKKYSGRGKFMPLPLKSKILETPRSLVTDDIKMLPL